MNVALPEIDGRILSRAVPSSMLVHSIRASRRPSCAIAPSADRVDFVARLAAAWVRLRATPPAERRVAIVLANYPNRDGRIANGVGLDTPAGRDRSAAGDARSRLRRRWRPADGAALMTHCCARADQLQQSHRPASRRDGFRLTDYKRLPGVAAGSECRVDRVTQWGAAGEPIRCS